MGPWAAPPASEGHSSSVWLRRQKGSASLAALTPPTLPGWPDALVETEGGELWRILPTGPRLRKTEKFEKWTWIVSVREFSFSLHVPAQRTERAHCLNERHDAGARAWLPERAIRQRNEEERARTGFDSKSATQNLTHLGADR
jgi:hypothetical protein